MGEWSEWSKCPACQGRQVFRTREELPENQALVELCQFVDTRSCAFPCGKRSFVLLAHCLQVDANIFSRAAALQHIVENLSAGDYLALTFPKFDFLYRKTETCKPPFLSFFNYQLSLFQ